MDVLTAVLPLSVWQRFIKCRFVFVWIRYCCICSVPLSECCSLYISDKYIVKNTANLDIIHSSIMKLWQKFNQGCSLQHYWHRRIFCLLSHSSCSYSLISWVSLSSLLIVTPKHFTQGSFPFIFVLPIYLAICTFPHDSYRIYTGLYVYNYIDVF